MARRKKAAAAAVSTGRTAAPTVGDAAPPSSRPNRGAPAVCGKRRWAYRLGLLVLGPALFFGLLEGVLRVAGFGYPTAYLLKTRDGKAYLPNRQFGWQYFSRESSTHPHPFLLPAEKAPGTTRIFILGESAALGTPAPPFGFGRILEVMLARQFPDRRVEVINAAMRGVNSHIILPIARECAGREPDVFLIYMGNNEAIGAWSPEPDSRFAPSLGTIRALQFVKRTKLYQLLAGGARLVRRPAREIQDMDFFRRHRFAADDPRREPIYRHFRSNLEDILRVTGRSGAKVLVSTVGANLKDFPPIGSLHRRDLTPDARTQWEAAMAEGARAEAAGQFDAALKHYTAAARLDDHYAELHFRLARAALAAGQSELAREHFALARDWDALQFRTDRRLNGLIREVAGAASPGGPVLVDAEQAFAANPLSDHQVPGHPLFNDHVHLSFDGDYLLARTFFPAVVAALGWTNAPAAAPGPPSRADCAEVLGFTAWEEVNVAAGVVRSLANPPYLDQLEHRERQARAEQSIQQRMAVFTPAELRRIRANYLAAIQRRSADWQLRFTYGNFLLHGPQDYPAAVEEFKAVVGLMPEVPPLRHALANALLGAGRQDEALAQFREILRLDGAYLPAREGMAGILGKRRPAGARASP